jgi:FHA domain-containing protein
MASPSLSVGWAPEKQDLKLADVAPFRLSRDHFAIEKRESGYRMRDLRSALGTIVNCQPIGIISAPMMRCFVAANEVIAGGGFTVCLLCM